MGAQRHPFISYIQQQGIPKLQSHTLKKQERDQSKKDGKMFYQMNEYQHHNINYTRWI
jgi:hypothetical protein